MKVVLEIVEGPHQGVRLEFERHETVLVGRSSTSQLRLTDDPHFSRHHLLLEINPPRCYLRDLGSRNGTFVNEQSVTECFLNHGDSISGGRTRIRVEVLGEQGEATAEYVGPSEITTRSIEATTREPVTPSAPEATERPPQFAPGYEIVRKLGQGGLGVVYLARHLATDQQFALKIIVPESAASETAMRRFLREISVLSQLDHPRIVRFHEMGMAQGQFFFAMEYVETINLKELLAGVSEESRVRIASAILCQVLDGLSHAHAQSFVHRDIKPANILVSRDGKKLRAKLADFGLAKNFENAGLSGMTHENAVMGTCAYMAPEQVVNARDVTPSVDLYACAATLYSLLAGTPPHDFSHTLDPLLVVLEQTPVPLLSRCPTLPRGLADAIHRALAWHPKDRFANADAMRHALMPYAKGVASD
jgi:serine/threonine-protein kinase